MVVWPKQKIDKKFKYKGNQPDMLKYFIKKKVRKIKHKHPFHMVRPSPWPFMVAGTLFVFIL
jgi:hypothetical protein